MINMLKGLYCLHLFTLLSTQQSERGTTQKAYRTTVFIDAQPFAQHACPCHRRLSEPADTLHYGKSMNMSSGFAEKSFKSKDPQITTYHVVGVLILQQL